jgi:glucose-1-phosphate thymidylyltransferase
MKGIILAGGSGTRLAPLTKAVSKQLLPVYKYPMIYFPINTLVGMGIKDILIITNPHQIENFKKVVQDLTCANFSFCIQEKPEGLAQAFILAQEWLNGSDATLVLGDNIIINNKPLECSTNTIFSYKVKKPERYGVVVRHGSKVISLVEKPKEYINNEAIIGLYILKNSACEIAKTLKPSSRGELEIVDLILKMNEIHQDVKVHELDGFWFDAGNPDDLLDCSNFIKAIEDRTNKSFDLT